MVAPVSTTVRGILAPSLKESATFHIIEVSLVYLKTTAAEAQLATSSITSMTVGPRGASITPRLGNKPKLKNER